MKIWLDKADSAIWTTSISNIETASVGVLTISGVSRLTNISEIRNIMLLTSTHRSSPIYSVNPETNWNRNAIRSAQSKLETWLTEDSSNKVSKSFDFIIWVTVSKYILCSYLRRNGFFLVITICGGVLSFTDQESLWMKKVLKLFSLFGKSVFHWLNRTHGSARVCHWL